jgi:hypothetical protein
LDVKGDTDISIDEDFIDFDDIVVKPPPEEKEGPLPNVARPVKIIPEILPEVLRTFEKYGEYINKINPEFKECVLLPPYEFVNQSNTTF